MQSCEVGKEREYRKLWIKLNGPVSPGLQLNHKCGTRRCINMDHIYLGSQAENMRDRSYHTLYPGNKLGAFHKYIENPPTILEAIDSIFNA